MTGFRDRPPVNFQCKSLGKSRWGTEGLTHRLQRCRVNGISPKVEGKAVLHLWARV